MSGVVYDRIGLTYGMSRRSDPRIAAVIRDALGDSGSVVNVGAGVGGYEPTDRHVVAVEPSAAMIAQRPASAAPVVQASAEALPFSDKSTDAALAVNTVHHWTDLAAGLRELRRVARKRVVIFLRIPHLAEPFWLAEYLPALEPVAMMRRIGGMIDRELGPGGAVPVPLPNDCTDGMCSAYWARPERYLDPDIRRNISNFALADAEYVERGLAQLQADIDSGAWDDRYGHIRTLPQLDLGHRVLITNLAVGAGR